MGVGKYLSCGHRIRGVLVGAAKFLTRACGEEPAELAFRVFGKRRPYL